MGKPCERIGIDLIHLPVQIIPPTRRKLIEFDSLKAIGIDTFLLEIKTLFQGNFIQPSKKRGEIAPFFYIFSASLIGAPPLATHGFVHPRAQRRSLEPHISMNGTAHHAGLHPNQLSHHPRPHVTERKCP